MPRSEVAKAAVSRSDQLEEDGDLDGAIAVLGDAIRQDSTDPLLAALRGRLFRIRKEWRKAIADFDTALAMKPDAPTTLFFRGTCRAEVGDFEGAIADLENVIRLEPESADAYWELGIIHRFRRDLDRAIAAYKKAFALDPNRYAGLEEMVTGLEREIEESKQRS